MGHREGHALYNTTGKNSHLDKKGALIREHDGSDDTYLAQFDPLYLKEAFGWREFPKSKFSNITWHKESL